MSATHVIVILPVGGVEVGTVIDMVVWKPFMLLMVASSEEDIRPFPKRTDTPLSQ